MEERLYKICGKTEDLDYLKEIKEREMKEGRL